MKYQQNFRSNIDQHTRLIEIATRNVICFLPEANVGEAARIMAEKRISSLVVTDQERKPLGIVTERNMLHAMQSKCPPETLLKEIMSSPVITVPETISCLDAYQVCLYEGIRHLVIANDAGILGVASESDFYLHLKLSTLAGRRQVAAVMSRSKLSLPPNASLQEALDLMDSHQDNCVVITDAEQLRPLGIVTERDIVRLYSSNPKHTTAQLKEVMSSPVQTITLDNTINEAAELMLVAKVRHLVVVDSVGRTSGVINQHDLTQSLTLNLIDDKLIRDGAFLHTLVNTIPDLVWLKDQNGVYLACNARFERFFGAPASEIIGKTDYDFVSVEQADSFRQHDLYSMESNETLVNEEWIIFADDGHRELLETFKTPMRDSQGKLIGVLGIARDITERKQAAEALRESEIKYRQLFEAASDGIFLQDAYGFIDCNEKGAQLYGLSKAEVLGKSPIELAPERQPNGRLSVEVAGEMIAAALNGQPQQFEWRPLHAKGLIVDVEITLNCIEIAGSLCLQAVVRDITERKRAELALRESEEKLRGLFALAPLGIALTDMNGRYLEFNEAFHRICGYSEDELKTLDYWRLTPKKYQAEEIRQLEALNCCGRYGPYEKEYIHKDGRLVPLRLNGMLVTGDDGQKYIWSIVEDITESQRAAENLRITASVFDTSQEGILITDARNTILDANLAFTHITGYSRLDVLGKNPSVLSSGCQDNFFWSEMWQALKQNKVWRGEVWNRRKSGELYAELLSISVICNDAGEVLRYVGVFSDISYLKKHEAELSRVAHHDALTGLPNRVLLADRMKHALAHASRENNRVAVCYLDLDGFKAINDSMGHEAGDQVLIGVARRIENTIRGGDTVARLGGDEFVVLLDLKQDEDCFKTLERLLTVIGQPITIKDRTYTVGASIGVSIYPIYDADADTLLRHADQAMYVAKQSGKNRFCVFDPDLEQRTHSHKEFLNSIRHGLEQQQFEIYYQPKINLLTEQCVGAEALIRWRHPERGLLSPREFLPPIESTELGIEIGNWVIASVLNQINCWRAVGLNIEVSINISAYHLESSDFVENLQQQLQEYPDIPPGTIQIEVLETVALNDMSKVRKIIEACHNIGVEFALDDFGTGYSSLSYLSRLPVKVIKIDQSFVQNILIDSGDKAIVQGIIALAKVFDLMVVAEGIETLEQYWELRNMGCEIGQGYGIARPMLAAELSCFGGFKSGIGR